MDKNFGESIFSNLLDNAYLRSIYSDILYLYARSIIKGSARAFETRDFSLRDALQFATLLSLSTDKVKGDKHRTIAQEMVTLLHDLFPDNKEVSFVMSQVLDNIGNYRGLEHIEYDKMESEDLLETMARQFEKEQMIIPAEPNKYFFKSQKRAYDNIRKNDLSFSGPTSMGKSFVMRMFIKAKVQEGVKLNFALVIPTKALINEVSRNVISDLKSLLGEKNYRIVTTSGDLVLSNDHNFILVMTPERLLYLLCDRADFKIDYVFIDEAHKISSKDKRSAFYYQITEMLLQRERPPRFIFASPNIPNPQVYLELLKTKTNEAFSSSLAPVCQEKILIDITGGRIAFYNNITDELEALRDITPGIKLEDVISFLGRGKQNLVYCHSRANAVQYALKYYEKCVDIADKDLDQLINSVKSEIHEEYYLAKLLRRGIAYHVGYLPSNIRNQIESLYHAGKIRTMFCTSTLIEGVNLPADNLFITSVKNGASKLKPIDFQNLVGRVGRIEHSLFGNVFLICSNDNPIATCEELLETKIPDQQLSVESGLSRKQKEVIIENLKKGLIEIPKSSKSQTNDEHELVRKISVILLRDIMQDRDSRVKREFKGLLSHEDEVVIKMAFKNKGQTQDDDINTSCDQVFNLKRDIEAGVVEYPNYNDSDLYEKLVSFLNKLAVVFKWDVYEKSTLGYKNKQTGEFTHIRFYATILLQWVQGYGLNSIIQRAIEYKEQHPESGVWSGSFQVAREYDKTSMEHKNIVISETLSIIDSVILFSISNYFLRFSSEFIQLNGTDSLKDNDWYEYVEYGTTNKLTIFLQRCGFSRESADHIRRNQSLYLVLVDGEYRLRRTMLESNNYGVRTETESIVFNMPDLFVD
ncbi:MAG: DEAD/DEAH box helicase [Spirochaetales bacterium]|nr:DEAD/DEAH box helicase [Spirochaetales bacterium]